MSDDPRPARWAALAHPDFRNFQLARFAFMIASQMQGVAVAWLVYLITGRALSLGLVGLAHFLPAVVLFPLTGHAADRFDRRLVLLTSFLVQTLASSSLWLLSRAETTNVTAVYAVLAVFGGARAFSGPAGHALVPNLVPRQLVPSAISYGASAFQLAMMVGPALGGLLMDALGPSAVFLATTGLELVSVGLLLTVRTRSRGDAASSMSLGSVSAGLAYVWQKKILLGAISLDLFAVLLGGAVALMPIFAREVLHAGPSGLGVLRSAPAVGAALTAVWLALRPLGGKTGRTMFACVFLFGLATIVFGLSRSLTVSVITLAVAGSADMVSVYVRHSLVQLETPDAMRGRVSAVNLLFIGASNELGEFESGLTAAWLGAVPAVVLGGVGTCVIVIVWAALFPALRRADRLNRAI